MDQVTRIRKFLYIIYIIKKVEILKTLKNKLNNKDKLISQQSKSTTTNNVNHSFQLSLLGNEKYLEDIHSKDQEKRSLLPGEISD